MFLLVPAYPGCPGSKAVKRSLLLLLYNGTTRELILRWKTDYNNDYSVQGVRRKKFEFHPSVSTASVSAAAMTSSTASQLYESKD